MGAHQALPLLGQGRVPGPIADVINDLEPSASHAGIGHVPWLGPLPPWAISGMTGVRHDHADRGKLEGAGRRSHQARRGTGCQGCEGTYEPLVGAGYGTCHGPVQAARPPVEGERLTIVGARDTYGVDLRRSALSELPRVAQPLMCWTSITLMTRRLTRKKPARPCHSPSQRDA